MARGKNKKEVGLSNMRKGDDDAFIEDGNPDDTDKKRNAETRKIRDDMDDDREQGERIDGLGAGGGSAISAGFSRKQMRLQKLKAKEQAIVDKTEKQRKDSDQDDDDNNDDDYIKNGLSDNPSSEKQKSGNDEDEIEEILSKGKNKKISKKRRQKDGKVTKNEVHIDEEGVDEEKNAARSKKGLSKKQQKSAAAWSMEAETASEGEEEQDNVTSEQQNEHSFNIIEHCEGPVNTTTSAFHQLSLDDTDSDTEGEEMKEKNKEKEKRKKPKKKTDEAKINGNEKGKKVKMDKNKKKDSKAEQKINSDNDGGSEESGKNDYENDELEEKKIIEKVAKKAEKEARKAAKAASKEKSMELKKGSDRKPIEEKNDMGDDGDEDVFYGAPDDKAWTDKSRAQIEEDDENEKYDGNDLSVRITLPPLYRFQLFALLNTLNFFTLSYYRSSFVRSATSVRGVGYVLNSIC